VNGDVIVCCRLWSNINPSPRPHLTESMSGDTRCALKKKGLHYF